MSWGSLVVSIVVTIEEISQIFVAGRTFDRSDLVFDYPGIFLPGELAGIVGRQSSKSAPNEHS